MSCCDAPAWVCQFDQKRAAGDLRDYREGGPAATTRALIDALVRAGVEQRTVLDIGGGVGAIQLALLKAGARAATSVDVSAAYLAAAGAGGGAPGPPWGYHFSVRGLLPP